MTGRIVSVERVYEIDDSRTELRLLVDRLWPRGVKRADLPIDDWSRNLAPSAELRKWFGHDPARFEAFADKYVRELNAFPVRDYIDNLAPRSPARPIVLLTASKDLEHSHARVLADYLSRIL